MRVEDEDGVEDEEGEGAVAVVAVVEEALGGLTLSVGTKFVFNTFTRDATFSWSPENVSVLFMIRKKLLE